MQTARNAQGHGWEVVRALPLAVQDEQPRYPTLVQAGDRFFVSLAMKSPKTRASYATGLRRFFVFLEQAGVDPHHETAERLPTDVLELYAVWLVKTYGRAKPATIHNYAAGVRAFFRYLIRRQLAPPRFVFETMKENLSDVLGKSVPSRAPRIDRRIPLIVLEADRTLLPDPNAEGGLFYLTALRDRALLHVLFTTGMRRAEVVSLSRSDVQDGGASECLVIGKGQRERMVFFDDDARAAIRAYIQARADRYAPLFLRHDHHRGQPGSQGEHWRMSAQMVGVIVKHYAELAGVRAHPHAFRHLKARTLLNRGASLSEVQDILGHADPSTTKRIYALYDTSTLRESFYKHSASAAELAAQLDATGG